MGVMEIGGQSMVGAIRKILLKQPREAFVDRARVEAQWRGLGFVGPPDLERAAAEYDHFVDVLRRFEMEVHFLPRDDETGLDSIYVHDPLVVCDRGVVLCRMGKEARRGEPEAAGRFLAQAGVPILGRITGEGCLEGGDVVWIDERRVAVGQGYRSNAEGIRQFRDILGDAVDEVLPVPLPHWDGPEDVLHLMSLLSPIDRDLAVAYPRLLPVPFLQWLEGLGIRLVEVPDAEYDNMACNVLALAPRRCLMLAGNPKTRRLLEEAGADVWTYEGREISFKGSGGPTCLTRPLLRLPAPPPRAATREAPEGLSEGERSPEPDDRDEPAGWETPEKAGDPDDVDPDEVDPASQI
ncbi:MAG TPA: arginine deiminase family protein [Candidatus Polarisedimenticolia bacterium]|nr:arginine deiminase family protein [Candidatus Polarisedimenticolia bacterium]